MRRLRKPLVGTFLFLAAVTLLTNSCCLTHRLWGWAETEPVAVEEAVLTDGHSLHLLVRYEDGSRRQVEAVLGPPGSTYEDPVSVRIVGGPEPSLPRGTPVSCREGFLVPAESDEARLGFVSYRGKRGKTDHHAWFESPGHRAVVTLPRRYPAGNGRPVAAVALTLPAFAVDVVATPVWFAWIIATAGGHGKPWLPWCR